MKIAKIEISRRKVLLLGLALLFLVGGFLFLRSPYMSNMMKKVALAELNKITGMQVLTRRMYVNLMPLFVGFEDLKVVEDSGVRLMDARSGKLYLDFWGLFARQIIIDRTVVEGLNLKLRHEELANMLERATRYEGKKSHLFKLTMKTVVLRDANFAYEAGPDGLALEALGLEAELHVSDRRKAKRAEATVSAGRISLVSDHLRKTVFTGGKTRLSYEGGSLRFEGLHLAHGATKIDGEATVDLATGVVSLATQSTIAVSTVHEMLGLKGNAEGEVYVVGKAAITNSLAGSSVDLKMKGDFDLDTLLEALDAKPPGYTLTGRVRFEGILNGPVAAMGGSGKATIEKALIYGVRVDSGSTEVLFKDNVLSIVKGKCKVHGGAASVEVVLPLPDLETYSVDVVFSNVDSAPALGLIGLEGSLFAKGRVEGELRSSGASFSPHGRASYIATSPRQDTLGRIRKISGTFDTAGDLLYLRGFKASTLVSDVQFAGSVDLVTNALDIAGEVLSTDAGDVAASWLPELSGGVRVEASVRGKTSSPTVNASLFLEGAAYGGYGFGSVSANAKYRDGTIEILHARAEQGGKEHSLEGRLKFPRDVRREVVFDNPELELSAKVHNGSLGDLFKAATGRDKPVVGGSYEAEVFAGGTPKKPRLKGVASVSEIRVGKVSVERASLRYEFEKGTVRVSDFELADGNSVLKGGLQYSEDGSFRFDLNSDLLRLADIMESGYGLQYDIALKAGGEGTLSAPKLRAEAKFTKGQLHGRKLGDSQITAQAEGAEVQFNARMLEGAVSLVGAARTDADMPWDMDLKVEYDRYDYLIALFKENLPEDFVLALQGGAHLWGDKSHVNADFDLAKANVFMYGQGFSNKEPLKLRLVDRRLSTAGMKIRSGTAAFELSGEAVLRETYDFKVKGSAALSPLSVFFKDIEALRGDAEYDLAVTGAWEEPQVRGKVKFLEASLALKGILHRLTAINGTVYFEGNRLVMTDLKANMGGGEVKLSGFVETERFALKEFSLEATLKDVSTYLSKGFVVNFAGNLYLNGDASDRSLTGELWVNRARYTKRIDWKTWLLSAPEAQAKAAASPWLNDTKLNLRLFGSRNIQVDNNIAKANMKLDLFLRGSLGAPTLYGRVEAMNGRVFFRNSEFNIIKATADYSEDSAKGPVVSILAETVVKGYHIWMNLEGGMDQLDLTLNSTPPLENMDILALLTVGEVGSDLVGLEGNIGAAEATSLMTGQFQDELEDRLKNLTGFDRVQIDPAVSRTTGNVAPKVTVSKRLAGDKLFLTYYSTLDSTSEQEFKMEYIVNDHLSVTGGQDYTGGLGGDVILRFRFK